MHIYPFKVRKAAHGDVMYCSGPEDTVIYNRLQTLFMMTFKHSSFTPNHDTFLTDAIPFRAAYGTKPQQLTT